MHKSQIHAVIDEFRFRIVRKIADRVGVMKDGEIVETGPTSEIFENPQHPYTRMLFEASDHIVDLPDAREGAPLLRVEGVVRDYPTPRPHLFAKPGRFRAVDGVSFSMNAGDRLGLVGESGSGKSVTAFADQTEDFRLPQFKTDILQQGARFIRGLEIDGQVLDG